MPSSFLLFKYVRTNYNVLFSLLQIIALSILSLILPMVLSSFRICFEAPGLFIGRSSILSRLKRLFVQILILICPPITILVVRIQHEIAAKKFGKLKKMHSPLFSAELGRLGRLLNKMERMESKVWKIEVTFEMSIQFAISMIMVLFAMSDTKTTSAMEALFLPSGKEVPYIGEFSS